MIVVRLMGGLGNQMFQYAVGRKLAMKFNTHVILDTAHFENDPLRKFSLAPFGFEKRLCSAHDLVLFGLKEAPGIVARGYYKIARKLLRPTVVREKQFNFDEEALKEARKYTYLNGYWQSEKYFSDIRPVLIEDFTIQKSPENLNLELAAHIRSVNSVSLHIRRADYISNAKTYNFHGVCGLDYYVTAIETISKQVNDPVLFIFSDDIPWAKENLTSSLEMHFVDWNNAENSHEDLRLMSSCKHNIIANSSFSWWGAWLNTNESKIVVAPKKWFADKDKSSDDIIPDKWIKL